MRKFDDGPSLSSQTEAVRLLLNQLREMQSEAGEDFLGDDELVAGMVEGETSLIEAINHVIEGISEDAALIAGLKDREAKMEARRKRLETRNERRRWAIDNALKLARQPKFAHPLVHISSRKGAPVLDITAEERIPARYWKLADPTLDKRLLIADAKAAKLAGEEIDGCRIVEGEEGKTWKWS